MKSVKMIMKPKSFFYTYLEWPKAEMTTASCTQYDSTMMIGSGQAAAASGA